MLLANTFCLSIRNEEQILALSYNFPLTAAKNVNLHVLFLLCWRIACNGVVSEPKSRSGLGSWSEAEEAEEELGGRVCLWALSGMGKHATLLDLAIDTVIQGAGQGERL